VVPYWLIGAIRERIKYGKHKAIEETKK